MRRVLNQAQYSVSAKLGNEIHRFEAREIKILPASVVETPEFNSHDTLRNLGRYQDNTPLPELEIKSQETEQATVVDDKEPKEDTPQIVESEPQEKPKRKRKSQKSK